MIMYNPNEVGIANGNLFGFPFSVEEASIIIIPVPWEVTISYQAGTANAPQAILDASPQLDFYDPYVENAWQIGIAMLEILPAWQHKNHILRKKAEKYINSLETGHSLSVSEQDTIRNEINQSCHELNQWLASESKTWLAKNKLVGVLGGDHSTSLGLIQTLSKKYNTFSILQIDAHADLRQAYEGFTFSHASIMYNALKYPQVERLVQVGIRDICPAEVESIRHSHGRIVTFFDWDLKKAVFAGQNWSNLCKNIISQLSKHVYISFDIDGLDPKLCPHTGTPVPGGLQFEEALHLISSIVDSGRTIIGFDLCEIAPAPHHGDEWDANVGSRLLYRLANLMAVSNKKIT